MSAYACQPNRGSEAGVGWNWALQAARFYEVWVLTCTQNRATIEAELAQNPRPGLHFIYHELPARDHLETRSERLYAYLWEISAVVAAHRANKRIGFDVSHHVTFNSIELPGLLWLLSPPFVWGPVGGGQEPPAAFMKYLGGALGKERLRVLRKRSLKFNPMVRLAVKRSQLLLSANRETQEILESLGARAVRRELETAVASPSYPVQRDVSRSTKLDLIWVGVLVARKAPLLAVEAVETALSRGVDCTLTFVGDGSLRGDLENRIASSSILAEKAKVIGQVPYEEMRQMYMRAGAFLFTSLNDTSGNVVLEAMSLGLPVITLNHQGAAEMVTDDTGIKIPVHNPGQVISDIADAIEMLSRNPDLRSQMGREGQKRIENEYTWAKKGDEVVSLYETLLSAAR